MTTSLGGMLATRPAPTSLAASLREALQRRQFALDYQPVVSLTSGAVLDIEVLARWRHPERGTLMADDFIAGAEQTGLIVELGAWVLDEACRSAARWVGQEPDREPPGVNINLSQTELLAHDLLPRVLDAIARSDLRPQQLCVDVSQRLLGPGSLRARRSVHALHDVGVRVAVDDLGSDGIVLRDLKSLPLDVVKIDGSVVGPAERDRARAAELSRLVNWAHEQGAIAVAERLETDRQATVLRRLGCDAAEGAFFAPPMPAAWVVHLLDGQLALGPE